MPSNADLLARIDAYIDEHVDDTIAELAKLCAVPSVSAQHLGIDACAALVADMLRKRGFEAEVVPSAGHPVVLAAADGAGQRTLLCYNHYDVQPPEPLELWHSPPFELTRDDGKLIARGVADDKGEIMGRLAAIDAVRAVMGQLPCRVKFLVEGEEEISSPSLPDVIAEHAERLSADACVWEFGSVNPEGAPIQFLGLRGICYVELSVDLLTMDAHSGIGGSIFPNAAWRLVWALNTLKDSDERILIPGFYDAIVPPSPRDMELLAALPDDAPYYRETFGVKQFLKDLSGVELRREEVFVPTCTICGLNAGYQGPGSKTVLPARASAKVDFRLVPDQDPADIVAKLRAHLDAQGFSDVRVDFLGGEKAGRTDPDDPFVALVVDAANDVYDLPTQVRPMIGGSGPNHAFIEHLHVPIVTLGGGYPGSRAHAPDENIRIDDFVRGAKHMARVLVTFGES
ncbi:MAG TPA: M20/M25/M40 family metallo-hydrolase [Roseiflexaceae bacterium]|nr:M20/M25/M40 family metallo-hydrolase [Roseiflexaceae bacterium]